MLFDQKFWDEDGYVVISDAVPQENLQATIDALWVFTGKNPNNRDEWYQEPVDSAGMVNMSHHQTLWDNRQSPRIHQAFTQIWGTPKLWVTINRGNINLPVTDAWDRKPLLHWDMELDHIVERPALQGVLSLTDTTDDMGGFHCVPGSHRRLAEWQQRHPGEKPQVADVMEKSEVVPLETKAGNLVIWHQGLIHGNGRNVSDKPRYAQYICMTPEGTARNTSGLVQGGEELRRARVASWQNSPYQKALADALGVPEAFIEKWTSRALRDASALNDIPQPRHQSQMNDAQISALPELLMRQIFHERAEVQILLKQARFGVTLGFNPFLCKLIWEALPPGWNLPAPGEPARLTDLGKKLLGVEAWT